MACTQGKQSAEVIVLRLPLETKPPRADIFGGTEPRRTTRLLRKLQWTMNRVVQHPHDFFCGICGIFAITAATFASGSEATGFVPRSADVFDAVVPSISSSMSAHATSPQLSEIGTSDVHAVLIKVQASKRFQDFDGVAAGLDLIGGVEAPSGTYHQMFCDAQ